ncbi:PREDICTED: probable disease resistance [Prunus dulcis]|uniref:PREDICTED: probable disease resistance n=1 Tax=Prunus dulcis TaxID=3755 RepID=A0A5E4E491_PRUDU|nr:probable disease resistance protein At5g66900 [Prunus dulcis]KAI5319391.1 hypothetical protein L3X38_039099 [Prunus dulcis]VVA09560.1 PREDICTED: probable disease resistance [Prunus dulcis]
MAFAAVGGAGLGAVFGALLDGVIAVTSEATMFETHLRDLKCTLDLFQQVDEDVRQHPNILFRPMQGLERFEIQMEKGVQLVEKCSKVCPWKPNVFNKRYTRKLIALDASLRTLLSVLTAHIASDLRARVINVATVVNHIDANIVAQNQNVNQIKGWSAIPEPPPFTVGLDVHVEELKLELLKDEASMLVVTGLGGCGKTTLAQKVCEDQKVKEKFRSNIFFVIVSKSTNCLVVQELCQKTGSLVPALQEEAIAFNWLQEFLKKTGQDPLLLVLDDVWLGSESLLDKFGEFKRPNYNILVTSRFRFPRFGPAYPLGTLEQGDAMTLFRHAASRPDRSSDIPEDLAKQIVQLCKGFPLAITTIGRSVCERPTEIWKERVAELSRGSSILDSEDYLFACLKSSLDALDERLAVTKECFIDLASFPEDRCIPAVALIDMWAELYGLDEDLSRIHELTNRNLANLVTRNGKMEMDGYYSEHFVTQHDMLRNLSIHQTGQDEIGQEKRLIIEICGDNLPNGWTEQKNKPKKTRLLSISTDGLSSAKWHDMHPPKAEVLVLNFQTENYVLPKFVKKMSKLKVLIVTNCGVLQADLSNFKLLGSLANLKRIRLERISIPSISKNFMQLKSLQKISLFMCSIGQAFSNSSIQILEAFPNLVEMNIDYCNDLVELPAKLCDLIRLKKLSITNCHKLSALPEEIGKLVNLEVLRLRSSTELERLPGSIKNLNKLSFLDIYNCSSIKKLPEEIGEMSSLRKINMGQCSRLQGLPQSVLNLGELREVICDEETENLWGEPFKSSLININITVAKEQHNLNWLYCKP